MSLPYKKPDFIDGDFTAATAVSLPVFSSPIPATTAEYVLTQNFMQYRNNFTALAQGTPHPDYPNFFLAQEGEKQDKLGGVVQWTRTYFAVPASYDEFDTYLYNFIGFWGTFGASIGNIPTGRPRNSLKVDSRISQDFFLVPSTLPANDPRNPTGVSVTINSPGDIPIYQAQKYRISLANFTWWLDVDFLFDNPPLTNNTTPSRATYGTWMQNAARYDWDPVNGGTINYTWNTPNTVPTFTDHSSGLHPCQIVAEDSNLTRWQGFGPVWLRTTRWILAQ